MPTYAHSDAYACVNVYEYLAILERKKERKVKQYEAWLKKFVKCQK